MLCAERRTQLSCIFQLYHKMIIYEFPNSTRTVYFLRTECCFENAIFGNMLIHEFVCSFWVDNIFKLKPTHYIDARIFVTKQRSHCLLMVTNCVVFEFGFALAELNQQTLCCCSERFPLCFHHIN